MTAAAWPAHAQRAEFDRGGPPEVLRLVCAPVRSPGAADVVVRVGASSINPKDTRFRSRPPRGDRFPRSTGFDFAGTVVACGPDAGAALSPGLPVWGFVDGVTGGAAAEYLTIPAAWVAASPRSLRVEAAATVPLSASAALQALRDVARVAPGEHVAVWGAGGVVGRFAVQIALQLGAEVTAVSRCPLPLWVGGRASSTHVRECTRSAFVAGMKQYGAALPPVHVLLDASGDAPWAFARALLARNGTAGRRRWITVGPRWTLYAATPLSPVLAALRLTPSLGYVVVRPRTEDLRWLAAAVDAGHLVPPQVQTWRLDEIVAAHRAAEAPGVPSERQVLTCH